MKKVLILSYYYPPSGGSGVQRWLYFSHYLSEFGIEPVVITVDPEKASYKFIDQTLLKKVENVRILRTDSREPLHLYTKLLGGDKQKHLPQGFAGESNPSAFQKLSRFIRGNFFLPDARKGWNSFAYRKAKEILQDEKFDLVITTGPPHSTHFIGEKLKQEFGIKWMVDFQRSLAEVYYNNMLYRTRFANRLDRQMEKRVLENADAVLTIGPGMKRFLEGKFAPSENKVHFVYNGYDSDLFDSQIVRDRNEKFVICHSGILSENQPITAFLEGFKLMFDRIPGAKENCIMQFVGKVSPSMIAEAKSVFNEVDEKGYLLHKESVQFIRKANLLLNSFAQSENTSLLVSGKLMEYLATGNPVICLGNTSGDAADLMKEIEQADIFDRADVAGISAFIEKVYLYWKKNEKFPSVSIHQYSRRSTTEQLATLIKKLV